MSQTCNKLLCTFLRTHIFKDDDYFNFVLLLICQKKSLQADWTRQQSGQTDFQDFFFFFFEELAFVITLIFLREGGRDIFVEALKSWDHFVRRLLKWIYYLGQAVCFPQAVIGWD